VLNALRIETSFYHFNLNISEKARIAQSVMEEKRNAYRLLVGKPEGRRPLEGPRRRWVDKMDLGEIGRGGVDWIGWEVLE
jgi:hypothetical protein